MATFKVGQRVRVRNDPGNYAEYRGVETRIFAPVKPPWPGFGDEWWELDIIAPGCVHSRVQASSLALEPLTDPREEQWAADAVRKVTKPDPVSPKVPVREESNQGECMK